jgi:hypothetical protein
MATIVGLRRKKVSVGADDFVELDIVDGQQRLTTLILMFKAICKALQDSVPTEKKLATELRDLLVKGDDLSLLLLQTNHDASHIFADYLRDGTHAGEKPKIVADKNLIDGIAECESFVGTWVSEGRSLIDLTALLRHRLSVIFHEIEDESLVYTVFEVLNSRGLDVTWFDKLKSLLMALVFEHAEIGNRATTIAELHNLWRDTYRIIGLQQNLNKETVRFAGTLKASTQPNRPLDEEGAVGELITQCGVSVKKAVECTKWVLKVTKAEDRLLQNYRLRAVTQIVQARLVAIAVLLRGFPATSENEILRRWENVTFRIYALKGNDARTAVGDYVRLAWQITNKDLAPAAILSALTSIGRIAPIKDAVQELWKADCYNGWTESLRYFLFRYEEHLADAMGQALNASQWNKIWQDEPSKSIEHVKAQSTKVAYVHRLGNLTALPPGVNSSLKAKDPKVKAKTYETCGLLGAIQVAKEIKSAKWSLASVEKREKRLIKWAMTEWAD